MATSPDATPPQSTFQSSEKALITLEAKLEELSEGLLSVRVLTQAEIRGIALEMIRLAGEASED